MKRILFIGDSSIPPRIETKYDKTYTSLLKNKMDKDYKIEVYARTGNNSKKIFSNLEAFMLYDYNPNIVVLNYGIVDVFPRPYPMFVYRFLSCSGLVSYVNQFLKKTKLYYKLGNIFNFKETDINNFKKYSESIIKKLLDKKVEKIIIIGIIKPYKILLNSKNIDREILLYNEVSQKLSEKYPEVQYIDMYNHSSEDFTIWDGYHYSEEGSTYLAEEISRLIKND